jgi:plasmid stability protein
MKAVTLRNLPRNLEHKIRKKALESGRSLNKTVIDLLEEGAGIKKAQKKKSYHDLDSLAGKWSEREFREFERAVADQRVVDEELWK